MKKRIDNFILDSEEYPTMYDMVEKFTEPKTDDLYSNMKANKEFLTALLELVSEGKIMYDDKHDIWIYTGGSNPKLQKLMDEAIPLSRGNGGVVG